MRTVQFYAPLFITLLIVNVRGRSLTQGKRATPWQPGNDWSQPKAATPWGRASTKPPPYEDAAATDNLVNSRNLLETNIKTTSGTRL